MQHSILTNKHCDVYVKYSPWIPITKNKDWNIFKRLIIYNL